MFDVARMPISSRSRKLLCSEELTALQWGLRLYSSFYFYRMTCGGVESGIHFKVYQYFN